MKYYLMDINNLFLNSNKIDLILFQDHLSSICLLNEDQIRNFNGSYFSIKEKDLLNKNEILFSFLLGKTYESYSNSFVSLVLDLSQEDLMYIKLMKDI